MESLTEIGTRCGTDKVRHGFCEFYDKYLGGIRGLAGKVLEIGVHRGASLLMWREYFTNAEIHGVDLKVPWLARQERIQLHAADQSNREALVNLMQATGSGFDLIIDDGGHTMQQQQVTFGALFPHVRPGGYYVIEDLHTSFIENIPVFRGGQMIGSYETGVASGVCTTWQIVDAIRRQEAFESSFMLDEECLYIRDHAGDVMLFDRDGDRKHMTSIIQKRYPAGA